MRRCAFQKKDNFTVCRTITNSFVSNSFLPSSSYVTCTNRMLESIPNAGIIRLYVVLIGFVIIGFDLIRF